MKHHLITLTIDRSCPDTDKHTLSFGYGNYYISDIINLEDGLSNINIENMPAIIKELKKLGY